MKNLMRSIEHPRLLVALLLGATALFSTTSALAGEKLEYRVAGTFVEGCSCNVPCPCTMSERGLKHGCEGVGVVALTSGSYKGVNLAGAKIVYAGAPGNWIRLYVDAKEAQRESVKAFAQATYSVMGKIEAVKDASIELTGKQGRYTLTVAGGKILQITTEPVLGANKTSPVSHSNTFTPLSATVMQGKTIKGSYHDGERSFSLEGSNSYSNDHVQSSGKI